MYQKSASWLVVVYDIFKVSLLLLGGITSVCAQSPDVAMANNWGLPPVVHYSKQAYRAADSNFDIVQDHRGLMYFANGYGVLEFDGTRWNLIPNDQNSTVYSLCLDTLGVGFEGCTNRIYVGSLGDIGYLACDSVGSLHYRSLRSLLPAQDQDIGTVWTTRLFPGGVVFHSNDALFILQKGKIKVLRPEFRETAFGFHWSFVVNDHLYVTERSKGLHQLTESGLQFMSNSERFGSEKIWAMFPRDDGNTSIVTREKGFMSKAGDIYTDLAHPVDDLLSKNPPYFAAEQEGIKAIMTAQTGLLILNEYDSLLYHLTHDMGGLPDDDITNVSFDHDGNIWLALQNGICWIQLNSPFSHYDETSGISGLPLSSLVANNTLLVGTSVGLFEKKWSPPRHHTSPDWHFSEPFQDAGNVNEILKVGPSTFLMSVNGVFERRYHETSFRNILQEKRTYKLIPLQNDPWHLVGAGGDAMFLLENQSTSSNHPNWIFKSNLKGTGEHKYIVEDRLGYIWGNQLSGGFARMKIDVHRDSVLEVRHYGQDHGLPASSINKVYSLNGDLLFTTENGIHRFDYEKHTFSPDHDLNQLLEDRLYIHSLTASQKSSIWIWSSTGAGEGEEPILQRITTGSEGNYQVNYSQYLPLKQTFVSSAQLVEILPNGNVLFGTDKGLIHYKAQGGQTGTDQVTVLLRKVEATHPANRTIYGSSFDPLSAAPVLAQEVKKQKPIPYNMNGLLFTFACPHYHEADKNEFQYQLVGFDKNWSSWTTLDNKEYTNLPEGQYTFALKARNIHGIESKNIEYTFTIAPPWYRHWFAYLTYLGLSTLLIWAIVKFNIRRLEKAKRRLEGIVEERTSEIRAQKEEITTQAAELLETNNKLVEMDEFKQGLTSMIVHDLKNPLNALLNTSDSYSKDQQLVSMKQNATQMLTMVQNILDVDKYEEAKMTLQLANHHLRRLVDLAVLEVKYLADQKAITIHTQVDGQHSVRVDSEVVHRLIVNLLTNAIKYTPQLGAITISSLKVTDEMIKVLVEDTGEGIPTDKIDQVFAKFGQVLARKSGGVRSTGLGLTFCKLAVEAHTGEIGVDTELGVGSTFWFTLPINPTGVAEYRSKTANSVEQPSELILTVANASEIKSMAENLLSIPLYRVSQIRRQLKQIKDDDDNLARWRDQMLQAVKSGNKDEFSRLLNLVLDEQK